MLTRQLTTPLAIVAAAIAVGGGAYGIVSATSSSGSSTASAAPAAAGQLGSGAAVGRRGASGGAGSNARSGPAAGGASGTVGSTSKSSFSLTTSAGQKVTVATAPSTKYQSTSASAITEGTKVLVLGTTNGTTITATQVVAQTAGVPAPASAATVVAFKRGAPATAKSVGKIPADYRQGSGTIVSGTTANRATEAALAAYPGGIVDRVVKLSNGEYEVHDIGVSWPHHIFVSKDFKVVGAG
jgi:hypothetical protein